MPLQADATPPPGVRLSVLFDDDVPAGVETLLAQLLPPRRPVEPVTAPPGISPEPTATETDAL